MELKIQKKYFYIFFVNDTTIIFPYTIGFVTELFLILGLTLTIYYNYICFKLYKFKKINLI